MKHKLLKCSFQLQQLIPTTSPPVPQNYFSWSLPSIPLYEYYSPGVYTKVIYFHPTYEYYSPGVYTKVIYFHPTYEYYSPGVYTEVAYFVDWIAANI